MSRYLIQWRKHPNLDILDLRRFYNENSQTLPEAYDDYGKLPFGMAYACAIYRITPVFEGFLFEYYYSMTDLLLNAYE
jgi:hypothetical protein